MQRCRRAQDRVPRWRRAARSLRTAGARARRHPRRGRLPRPPRSRGASLRARAATAPATATVHSSADSCNAASSRRRAAERFALGLRRGRCPRCRIVPVDGGLPRAPRDGSFARLSAVNPPKASTSARCTSVATSDWCACWPCRSTSRSPISFNCASVAGRPLIQARLLPCASSVRRRSNAGSPVAKSCSASQAPIVGTVVDVECGGELGALGAGFAAAATRSGRRAAAPARRAGSTCRRRFRRSAPRSRRRARDRALRRRRNCGWTAAGA